MTTVETTTSPQRLQARAVASTFCTNSPVYYQQYKLVYFFGISGLYVSKSEVVLIQEPQCLCVQNRQFTSDSLQTLYAAYGLEPTATTIANYASKALTVEQSTVAAVQRNTTEHTLSKMRAKGITPPYPAF
jgi:hypothetical protein